MIDGVSTETASVPAIDMSAIMQLADNDDAGDQFVAEIIKVFLDDLSERVLTIGLQMKQDDRAGVAATAHAIKGSCGHFGAVRLVELSRDLEERSQAPNQPAILKWRSLRWSRKQNGSARRWKLIRSAEPRRRGSGPRLLDYAVAGCADAGPPPLPALNASITSVQPSKIMSMPIKSPMTHRPETGHELMIENPRNSEMTPFRISQPR